MLRGFQGQATVFHALVSPGRKPLQKEAIPHLRYPVSYCLRIQGASVRLSSLLPPPSLFLSLFLSLSHTHTHSDTHGASVDLREGLRALSLCWERRGQQALLWPTPPPPT